MRVFKIEGQVAEKYCGCGYALAAISEGNNDTEVVDIVYLRDIDPSFDLDASPEEIASKIFKVKDQALKMGEKGDCLFGMLSGYEFCEL